MFVDKEHLKVSEEKETVDSESEFSLKEINSKRKSPVSIEELTKEYYFCTGLDLFIY